MRPSKLSFGAPVFFVSKKGGQLRMCIDYRPLNRVTIKNNYHLSRVDDLLNRFACATHLSRIDLKSSYYQIRVADEDVFKTAMQTRYGSYVFLVMSFGLCNAPTTFMSKMNGDFHEEIDKCVVVHIDDILVYPKSELDHAHDLRQLLKKFRQHKLYVNADKSEFSLRKLEFLDHVLSGEGLRTGELRVRIL